MMHQMRPSWEQYLLLTRVFEVFVRVAMFMRVAMIVRWSISTAQRPAKLANIRFSHRGRFPRWVGPAGTGRTGQRRWILPW